VDGGTTCEREYLSSVADALVDAGGIGTLLLIAGPKFRDMERRFLALSKDGGGIDFDG
jgi:hypothetical protein